MSAKITAISQNLFENSNKNDEFYPNQQDNSAPGDRAMLQNSVTSVISVTSAAPRPRRPRPRRTIPILCMIAMCA
jgi:hypothetical protein